MATLYGRTYDLRIGPPGQEGRRWTGRGDPESGEIEGLQLTFEVEKTARARANKLRLSIYNLSSESVGFIEQSGNAITLTAGYRGADALLFAGTIAPRGVTTTFEGPDRVTTIEAGASELEIQTTRFAKSYQPGTPFLTVAQNIAETMGIGTGNLSRVAGLQKTFGTGYTFAGAARRALDEIVQLLGEGYSWSVQDGQLQVLERGETTLEQAVLLTPETGLVGAPQRQKKGLELTSLLRGEIKPGRLISVISRDFTGFFKCTQVTHTGDFRGNDWYSNVNARQVGT